MPLRAAVLSASFLTLISAAPRDLTAQMIKWSQFGSVTQMVGDTEIVIRYNRPVARGRELFGGIVSWGRVWNPGADSATTVAFSGEVRVDGHRVPAGKYSVWMIPDARGEWTLILSRAADVYHTPYPEGQDALRLTVKPESAPHMETLTFHFPVVDGPKAVLAFHWGGTKIQVAIEIDVEP